MRQHGVQVTRVPVPPAPPRASRQQAAANHAVAYGNCGIHSISISPGRSAPSRPLCMASPQWHGLQFAACWTGGLVARMAAPDRGCLLPGMMLGGV